MAIVKQIKQDGVLYDIHDAGALHDDSPYEVIASKVQEITASSTTQQYPSAKAVWDLFDSIVNGDEVDF